MLEKYWKYIKKTITEPEVSMEAASLFLRGRGKVVYILPSLDPTLALLLVGFTEYGDDELMMIKKKLLYNYLRLGYVKRCALRLSLDLVAYVGFPLFKTQAILDYSPISIVHCLMIYTDLSNKILSY
ncbi:hypothetical protein Hanom_Chr16g01437171 [Helianthus anomalus]